MERSQAMPRLLISAGMILLVTAGAIPAQEPRERDRYVQSWLDEYAANARKLERLDFEALRRGIRDLMATFPQQYRKGPEYLARAEAYEKRKPQSLAALKKRKGA